VDSLQDMQYARMKTMQEQFQTNLKVSCRFIVVIGPAFVHHLGGEMFVSTVVHSHVCQAALLEIVPLLAWYFTSGVSAAPLHAVPDVAAC